MPLDPIQLDYCIRVDALGMTDRAAFDVEVEIEDVQTRDMLLGILKNGGREVSLLDNQIANTVVKIENHRLKRDFMLSFSHSPSTFIQNWISQQTRDLEV